MNPPRTDTTDLDDELERLTGASDTVIARLEGFGTRDRRQAKIVDVALVLGAVFIVATVLLGIAHRRLAHGAEQVSPIGDSGG